MKRGPVKKAVKPLADSKFTMTAEYIESVRSHSYLGKKGYTVPKSILSPPDLEFLQKDLVLKPEIQGVTYGAPKDEGAFPVYRENDKKMYLPRFYGVDRYGLPDLSEIEPGMEIDVPFVKELRDYQIDIVDKYMAHVSQHASHHGQTPPVAKLPLELGWDQRAKLSHSGHQRWPPNTTKFEGSFATGELWVIIT